MARRARTNLELCPRARPIWAMRGHTCRLNSIECVRCLAMGFLLESPVQLADSQVPHLSTPRGALHVLPWWRVNADGSYVLFVRSGSKAIEFEKGKDAIAVPSFERIPMVIDILITAVRN